MRAAPSVVLVGVMTLSLAYRAATGDGRSTVVTSAVLPRTCATVVHVVPSVETSRSASFVSHDGFSPPAPALRSVNERTWYVWPRSTCSQRFALPEHHLSLVPPET